MTFEAIVKKYLANLESEYETQVVRGGSSGELPLRPTVHQFIVELSELISPSIDVAHEPRRVGRNKPDWRLDDSDTLGIYCYGDHKGIDITKKLDVSDYKKQFARYLKLGRPLFVTDGIDFVFLSPDSEPVECSLVAKPMPKTGWDRVPVEMGVEAHFREIVDAPGFRPLTDERLVGELARRARLLSETLLDLLEAGAGGGQTKEEEDLISSLCELQEIVSQHHDPSLREARHCADFVAQVLVFGLLYAHRKAQHDDTTPEDRRQLIIDFWDSGGGSTEAEKLRPFRALVDQLRDDLDPSSEVGAWYTECVRVLAHAECMSRAVEEPAYDTLFEEFLEAYDNKLRFDRGAFYTPRSLIEYIVRSADALSESHFGDSIYSIADRIIDPCCGTGGFLDEIIVKALETDSASTLVGFEVLPAPYALAQYRLARATQGTPLENQIKIILTDTLSDTLNVAVDREPDSALLEEIIEACELADPPLMVVVGNPPSSDVSASTAPRSFLNDLVEKFRPPKDMRADRQNTQKALNNEFVRFLAWSADKILKTGRGVLALVLPSSFANGVSYKYARKWIADNFSEIRLLVFDQDCRTGIASQSLFSTLQGRLVLFATLTDVGGGTNQYYFKNISSESRDDKLTYLSGGDCFVGFESFELDQESFQFLPIGDYDSELYQDCWPIVSPRRGDPAVFIRKCSGVKTGFTRALFHTKEPLLRRRNSEIGNSQKKVDELKGRWFLGQQRPPNSRKFTNEVRRTIGAAQIRPCTFRPFVEGFYAYDDNVVGALNGLGGGGDRNRPEVQAAFEQSAVSIVVAPAPANLGDSLTRFVSFAWSLPDNDISMRGNGMVYCDVFPEPAGRRGAWDSTALPNVAENVQELFAFSEDPLKAVVFYCYGIMSSDSYLERFEPILFRTSDPTSPPRIPILEDEAQRQQVVELGRQIASLERPGAALPDTYEPLELDIEGDSNFNLNKVESHPVAGELLLIDESKENSIKIAGIPESVLALTISGYNVVTAWLKERLWKYYRRDFREDDMGELIELLDRINAQCQLIDSVSEMLEQALNERAIVPYATDVE